MGLFTKREMDSVAAEAFWQWFALDEDRIIEALGRYDMDIVREIDGHLAPVFPYYKEELEFQLGFSEGTGEFILFHLGCKPLQRDGERFCAMMPAAFADRWTVTLEE